LNAYSGLPFKFKVIAENRQGSSKPSLATRILAAAVPTPPGAPINVDSQKSYILIRWTPPTNSGGILINFYSVYLKPDGESYTIVKNITNIAELSY
jgi:hypothetical protein